MLQVLEYTQGYMYKKDLEFTKNYSLPPTQVDPALHAFAQHIYQELESRFKEFTKEDIR